MKNVRTIWLVAVVLFLCACPALGVLEFKDGLTHNINYKINDDVWVDYKTPYMYTTVNLLAGGYIRPSMRAYENSQVNISGGSIQDWLSSFDSSQVNISGGSMNILFGTGSSQVDISGGAIRDLYSTGSSQVNISGGSIYSHLTSYDSSHVDISGGFIYCLYSHGSSQVDISGGSIGGDLRLYNQSKIQIYGSDFAVDGQPFGYGELTSILGGSPLDEPLRWLTGTLLSGELIDNPFRIGHDARIVLIPEPATIALLGIGLLFLRKR